MIMQILMQGSGNRVLNGRLHRMSCKTGAYTLAESGCSASPFTWVIGYLSNPGAAHDAGYSPLAVCAFFPMFHIRVTLGRNDSL